MKSHYVVKILDHFPLDYNKSSTKHPLLKTMKNYDTHIHK